jgi:YVTN family beta-propeller protein
VTVGKFPSNVVVTPNGQYVYVTNEFGRSLSVIETATNQVTETVSFEGNPIAIAVAPNQPYLYVGISSSHIITVLDTGIAPNNHELFNTVYWIILIVVIIVIALLLVLVLHKRRKKGPEGFTISLSSTANRKSIGENCQMCLLKKLTLEGILIKQTI